MPIPINIRARTPGTTAPAGPRNGSEKALKEINKNPALPNHSNMAYAVTQPGRSARITISPLEDITNLLKYVNWHKRND
jgi:hypothetical protein